MSHRCVCVQLVVRARSQVSSLPAVNVYMQSVYVAVSVIITLPLQFFKLVHDLIITISPAMSTNAIAKFDDFGGIMCIICRIVVVYSMYRL